MLIISNLSGKYQIIASLLFGAGLRINEALRLRIKDIDFYNKSIFGFCGKGNKDRYTLICRHHIHETAFRKQHRQAVKKSAIHKRVTAHTFRYTFATSYCALALTLERFKNR
ncbi:tyrosine-type recombinase/integrase [Gayadomonas joobiniege]|uniref:tyrosine-type recombinase/integrase n=1 Tax=Gayadomonas joobiniege TaxID=1234606 RepID=UPI003B438A6E